MMMEHELSRLAKKTTEANEPRALGCSADGTLPCSGRDAETPFDEGQRQEDRPDSKPRVQSALNETNDDGEVLELERDAYTLMFLSDFWSLSFLLSMIVFLLQMSILILTLVNQLRGPQSFNALKIPINNPPEVILAQLISCIVVVLLRGDAFVILAQLIIPPDEDATRFNENPTSTRIKWVLGNACRLMVCLLSILISFIFIVQTDEVLDIFKDFAAIQFVTSLGQMAFFCAIHGFFGTRIKENARHASSSHLITTRKWSGRRARLGGGIGVLVLSGMLAGWAFLVNEQETHHLLMSSGCRRVDVRFGWDFYDFANLKVASPFPSDLAERTQTPLLLDPDSPSPLYFSYFSSVYTISADTVQDDRPVYHDWQGEENSATAGMFSYCGEEGVWVFTIGAFDDGVQRGGCGQWLLRSEPTDEFFLENVPSGWTVWTGSAKPMSVGMGCVDCRKSAGESGCNFNGECNEDGTCSCRYFGSTDEDWFGEQCEAKPPCSPVDGFVYGESSSDYHQVAHFMPMLMPSNEERVVTYQRPVYWNKRHLDAEKQNFLLYTGSRWYNTDWPLIDMCPRLKSDENVTSCGKAEFARFFASDFHAYWFDTLLNNTMYVSEETESFTPVGLKWLSIGPSRSQGDYGEFGFTLDENLSVHCFKNDCTQTLCGRNGECSNDARYNLTIRSRCKCKNGSSGYFCQMGIDDGYVDSDQCTEYFCDYLEEQELGSAGRCSNACEYSKNAKSCWNTPEKCLADPAKILLRAFKADRESSAEGGAGVQGSNRECLARCKRLRFGPERQKKCIESCVDNFLG